MTIARTVCLGFIAVIAIGALLLIMPFSSSNGSWTDPVIALFTSTSAVCVTGLIVVDTGSYFSFWGQLIIVLLIQVGGFGYMMITTFLMLLMGKKFDLNQKVAIQESFDRPFLQGSQNLVRSILATTLIFEITGIFLLFAVFSQKYEGNEGLWLAIFHSVSAWNNAGFSLFPDSLVSYQSSLIVNLVISALIIFGGIGYQVIMEMFYWLRNKVKGNKQKFLFSLNFRVVISTTFFLLIMGAIAFFFTEFNNPNTLSNLDLKDKIITAWFQSVTTRTAGFNTIDIGKMTIASLFITIGFMFIGASPSGTGGGVKTTTIRILSNCTHSVLQGKDQVILYKRQVSFSLILKAIAVIFGSATTIIIATFLIAFDNSSFPFVDIFYEVVSAFATVGLSTGITASLSGFAKIVLILTMYTGRVGILFLMGAILGENRPSMVTYPTENLLVG
jgi:trk system potassium uptake protein